VQFAQWLKTTPGQIVDPDSIVDCQGMLFTILLGIAGAVIGGFVASQLFNWDINTFTAAGFAVAVGGGLLLLLAALPERIGRLRLAEPLVRWPQAATE
jgi:uncharacterized membrane protein YeaQ/YmgE (transglycosylase-associated protein family)